MGKLLDKYLKIYLEQDEDDGGGGEEPKQVDVDADSYGVEYRDMHSAIHHVLLCDTEEKAIQVFDILLGIKEIQDKATDDDMHDQLDAVWAEIDEFIKDDIEINYRDIEEKNGNKFYNYRGENIFIINDYIMDIYP